ncbi:hypothetical protein DUI87_00460 [Hirundo rustica rustica]|uniref:GATA-type domain-containing protein n=1 Tax=Hirundo rustica rustica TaxID=333673 RepID=A0A3M0LAV1_HIRRU|nr:hypothetical protein DUI87_00460 [Hirundo rustica rustica]
MLLELPGGDSGDCRLLITARGHSIPAWNRGAASSDDDPSPSTGRRRCASCGTPRTPMWRTAEGGTLLCNACGIR